MSGRLVVVEGNNGAGKSTVATHLRERMPATLFHYPEAFTRFRKAVRMDEEVGPVANLVYHLAATMHLADLVRERLLHGHVVCDRYLPGPLSLLEARRVLAPEAIEGWVAPFRGDVPVPDVTILLTVRHADACRRIRERASDPSPGGLRAVERWILESEEFFARRESALRHHAARLGPVAEIDTTGLSPDEVCRKALEAAG